MSNSELDIPDTVWDSDSLSLNLNPQDNKTHDELESSNSPGKILSVYENNDNFEKKGENENSQIRSEIESERKDENHADNIDSLKVFTDGSQDNEVRCSSTTTTQNVLSPSSPFSPVSPISPIIPLIEKEDLFSSLTSDGSSSDSEIVYAEPKQISNKTLIQSDENNHSKAKSLKKRKMDQSIMVKNDPPEEYLKYCSIIDDLSFSFTTDLPIHLYAIHLLHTRNRNLPPPDFTLWPSPPSDLVTPIPALRCTTTKDLTEGQNNELDRLQRSRYSYINIDRNRTLKKPSSEMLTYWRPRVDARREMSRCIDSIFENLVNKSVEKFDESYGDNEWSYRRAGDDDLEFSSILKEELFNKLDNVIDNLVDIRTTNIISEENHGSAQKTNKVEGLFTCSPQYGFDWFTISNCLDESDTLMKLKLSKLFSLELEHDIINGPVRDIPFGVQVYDKSLSIRGHMLKKVDKQMKINKAKGRQVYVRKSSNTRKQKFIKYFLTTFAENKVHSKQKRLENLNKLIASLKQKSKVNGIKRDKSRIIRE